MHNDIIAAIATPYGKGGIAIIRLSGHGAEQVLMRIFKPLHKNAFPLQSHMLTYGHLVDGDTPVDECMAVIMRAPRSYTREDVCEIHVHGGTVCASSALALCLNNGARLAQAGEFSRRAFENGRIDLSQAEAVMAMIASQGKIAQRAAMRELSGGAGRFIRNAQDGLYTLMAGLEAAIDYPEEVDEAEATVGLSAGLKQHAQMLLSAVDERGARIVSKGLSVTLCGAPNVGKSSLLNALLGEDRAIVTDIPGTTRDVLTGSLELNGIAVHLSDTAGLHDAFDKVEKIGIERAKKAMNEADCILLILDSARKLTDNEIAMLKTGFQTATAIVLNKSDLTEITTLADVAALAPQTPVFTLSAQDVHSLAPLKQYLMELAGDADALTLTNQRHLTLAKKAAASLLAAAQALDDSAPLDLAAVDLRDAMHALGEITGDQIEERVLDNVFATFCVGK